MSGTFWSGLQDISSLFAGLPSDIVAFAVACLALLAVLAVKRLFF